MGIFDSLKGRREGEASMRAKEHVKRCEALQHAGRMQEALQEAREAVKLDPACADAYYGLGRCYHYFARAENQRAGGNIYFSAGLENLDRAISAFEEVVRLQPRAADGHINLALAYDNCSRLVDAERCYREAIRLDPDGLDGADACGNLALLLYYRALGWAGLKQFPRFYETVIGDPALEAAFAMAEKEIHIRENVVRRNPNYVPDLIRARRRLGGWYNRFLQGNRALEQFQAILRLDPSDQEAREFVTLAERNQGLLGHGVQNPGKADEFLAPLDGEEKLLVSDLSPIIYQVVIEYKKTGELPDIVADTDEVYQKIELLKRLPIADLERLMKCVDFCAKATLLANSNPSEAAALYRKATELNPYDDVSHMSYGCLLGMIGHLREGITWVEKALKLNPDNQRAQDNLRTMKSELSRASAGGDQLTCAKCGKKSGPSGRAGAIVLGSPESFMSLVDKCQSCGLLVCGACAAREESGLGITNFKCPQCGGTIGPA